MSWQVGDLMKSQFFISESIKTNRRQYIYIYILGTNRILPFIFIKTNLWEPIVYCFIITLPGPNPSDTDKNESYQSQLGEKWQIPGLFYEVDYFEFLIGKFG